MLEIQEIPIEPVDPPENTQEICHGLAFIPENPEEIQPAPKKRGRPAGAKNKPKPASVTPAPKPKPNAKQKKQVTKIEYEEYTESEEEEETPPPRRRVSRGRAEYPAELDRHALASEVLGILQQQRYQQTNARRSHYASWFSNM